jgi:hypothetical protein
VRTGGYAYIAHIADQRWYCLLTNPLNEPEAIPVRALILAEEGAHNHQKRNSP